MSLTGAQILTAFNEEAGTASSFASSAEVWRWWSEGQARLSRPIESSTTLSWAAAAATVNLPTDFQSISKLDYPSGITVQEWRVFGKQLVLDDLNGASASAANVKLWYWAERPQVAASGDVSVGSLAEDYACLYYSLSRFYRKLVSNRVMFTRYSTLLGANAVSVGELQAESDRLLQDYRDARDDVLPPPPASFFQRTRIVSGT